ncbi:hypothetical protein [Mycobacterium hubeiense]|uniref:hypothetical protein n=1 Tax=Mycobacterium hubeiense TaxID=1867256 RepID=UPI0018EB2470|nr:hypothetical protein [Mycobacterium sp. QGD 101]
MSHVTYLADHTLLLALPAFAPAVVVAGVVAYIAIRNRRNPDDSRHDDTDNTDQDGSP